MTDITEDIMYSLHARLARLECKYRLQMSPAIGKESLARIETPVEGTTEHCLQLLKHLHTLLVPQDVQPFRSVIIAHPFRDSSLM
jgi:hypothetical protein